MRAGATSMRGGAAGLETLPQAVLQQVAASLGVLGALCVARLHQVSRALRAAAAAAEFAVLDLSDEAYEAAGIPPAARGAAAARVARLAAAGFVRGGRAARIHVPGPGGAASAVEFLRGAAGRCPAMGSVEVQFGQGPPSSAPPVPACALLECLASFPDLRSLSIGPEPVPCLDWGDAHALGGSRRLRSLSLPPAVPLSEEAVASLPAGLEELSLALGTWAAASRLSRLTRLTRLAIESERAAEWNEHPSADPSRWPSVLAPLVRLSSLRLAFCPGLDSWPHFGPEAEPLPLLEELELAVPSLTNVGFSFLVPHLPDLRSLTLSAAYPSFDLTAGMELLAIAKCPGDLSRLRLVGSPADPFTLIGACRIETLEALTIEVDHRCSDAVPGTVALPRLRELGLLLDLTEGTERERAGLLSAAALAVRGSGSIRAVDVSIAGLLGGPLTEDAAALLAAAARPVLQSWRSPSCPKVVAALSGLPVPGLRRLEISGVRLELSVPPSQTLGFVRGLPRVPLEIGCEVPCDGDALAEEARALLRDWMPTARLRIRFS